MSKNRYMYKFGTFKYCAALAQQDAMRDILDAGRAVFRRASEELEAKIRAEADSLNPENQKCDSNFTDGDHRWGK
jgi:hypothetical protein